MTNNFIDMIHVPIVDLITDDKELKESLKNHFPYVIFVTTKPDFDYEKNENSFRENKDLIFIRKTWEDNALIPENIRSVLDNYPQKVHIMNHDTDLAELKQWIKDGAKQSHKYFYENKKLSLDEWEKCIYCFMYFIEELVNKLKREKPKTHTKVADSIISDTERIIRNSLDEMKKGIKTPKDAIYILNTLLKNSIWSLNRVHIFGMDKKTLDLVWIWHYFINDIGAPYKIFMHRAWLAGEISRDEYEEITNFGLNATER